MEKMIYDGPYEGIYMEQNFEKFLKKEIEIEKISEGRAKVPGHRYHGNCVNYYITGKKQHALLECYFRWPCSVTVIARSNKEGIKAIEDVTAKGEKEFKGLNWINS